MRAVEQSWAGACQQTLASDFLVGLFSKKRSPSFSRVPLQRGGKVNCGELKRKDRNPRL